MESQANLASQLSEYRQTKAQAARDYIQSEIQTYSTGFSSAFDFDVDAFMQQAVNLFPSIYMETPPILRAEAKLGPVCELNEKMLKVGPIMYEDDTSHLPRKPYDDAVRQVVNDVRAVLFNEATRIASFPILGFDLTREHRAKTTKYTNLVYGAILQQRFMPDHPGISLRAYCEKVSKTFYSTDALDPSPMRRATLPQDAKVFLDYTSYENFIRHQSLVKMGLVFNPNRKTSQSLINTIEIQGQNYIITYKLVYTHYKTEYPVNIHDILINSRYKSHEVYTYPYSAWAAYLKIPLHEIHPKWYPFDMITTHPLEIPDSYFVLHDSEFIAPIQLKIAGQVMTGQILYDDQMLVTGLLRTHYMLKPIYVTRVKAYFQQVVLINKMKTHVTLTSITKGVQDIDVYRGYPINPSIYGDYFFVMDGEYYQMLNDAEYRQYLQSVKMEIVEKDGLVGSQRNYSYIDNPVYRGLSSTTESYVDVVAIISPMDAMRFYQPSYAINPIVRDTLLDLTDMEWANPDFGVTEDDDKDSTDYSQYTKILDATLK